MSVLTEYLDVTRKYQLEYGDNTILLMQVGSFFEVYGLVDSKTKKTTGSRIEDFSNICELRIAEKNNCVGADSVVMAGFKDIMIEKYIRKLQEAGFTIVVYSQQPAEGGGFVRTLSGIYSPGTYFPDCSSGLTNNITCIWIDYVCNKILVKGRYVIAGVANIDIYTGKTSIFQFQEAYTNNPTNFDELERFISIYNPSEVILLSNLSDNEQDDVISYTNIKCNSIHRIRTDTAESNTSNPATSNPATSNPATSNPATVRAKNCEKPSYQKEIITKFYAVDDYEVFSQNFYDHDVAAKAFCFLLDFVYQHNPNLVNKIDEPVFENCSTRLTLANHSLKQLNIIDDSNYTGKYSSVAKMLNRCITPMGKRKFAYNFVNPTTDRPYLEKEYNITEHLLSRYDSYEQLFVNKLSSIKDITKLNRLVFMRKITPDSFVNLYNNIITIKDIYEQVTENKVMREYLLLREPQLMEIGNFCDELMKFIEKTLDLTLSVNCDQCQNFETNFIRSGVDANLDEMTTTLKESEMKMESIRFYLNGLIENKEKKGGPELVKIHETEKNKYSLVSTSRRCKLLEDALPTKSTVIQLKTSSGIQFEFKVSRKQFEYSKQTASNDFITDSQIGGLCKNITNVKVAMKDAITVVYNTFLHHFESYQNRLESIVNFITLIDVIFAKATIAKKYCYCKPKIVDADKSFVNAKGLRHCLIEHLQTNELYVTNDISLGNGVTDGILLYGTNAVGKTSLIRAIGISVIMAQSGLYVPCSEFQYCPYKYLFTRIIGNDNLFKGLSTFAVEMSELRTILRLADNNSLILGDELCSGTENISAVSIFVAGIQKLHKLKSSFIFATHLHEIVDYDEITGLPNVGLKHMTVVYDKDRDMLIYDRKLKDGPGNSLYGLEVCKSLSLPDDFLAAAYSIRAKYHPESGSVLALKSSHFNAQKIVSVCEMCKKGLGTDVHHLQHQNEANADGIIMNNDSTFHKNKLANLMTLCDKCHDEIHKTKIQHKRVKTTKGYKLVPATATATATGSTTASSTASTTADPP
jgi:DNA mismatch repair protein MutS